MVAGSKRRARLRGAVCYSDSPVKPIIAKRKAQRFAPRRIRLGNLSARQNFEDGIFTIKIVIPGYNRESSAAYRIRLPLWIAFFE
jgi:hypothetical protein